MKLKSILTPIFAMSLVSGCEDQPQSQNTVSEANNVQVDNKIESAPSASSNTETDLISKAEEKFSQSYPSVFDTVTEEMCMLKTGWAISFNKDRGINDPNIQEANSYYTQRLVMARGENAPADAALNNLSEINRLCNGNLNCPMQTYQAMADAAPDCVQKYQSQVKPLIPN